MSCLTGFSLRVRSSSQDVYFQFRFVLGTIFISSTWRNPYLQNRKHSSKPHSVVLARIFHAAITILGYFSLVPRLLKVICKAASRVCSCPALAAAFAISFAAFITASRSLGPLTSSQSDISFVGTSHFIVTGILWPLLLTLAMNWPGTSDTTQGIQYLFLHIRITPCNTNKTGSAPSGIGNRTDHILLCFRRTGTTLQSSKLMLICFLTAIRSQRTSGGTAHLTHRSDKKPVHLYIRFPQHLKLADNKRFCF